LARWTWSVDSTRSVSSLSRSYSADGCATDAPLDRTPVLVRAGGILVLGGECTRNIYDGIRERTALIFPSPSHATSNAGRRGTFTIIEDDGKTNGHTIEGAFTEIVVSFEVVGDQVEIGLELLRDEYDLTYGVVWFELPKGDEREMVGAKGRTIVREDGRVGLKL
jgi:alpha-glucosidase